MVAVNIQKWERGDVLIWGDHGGLWENMVGLELDIERKGSEISGWWNVMGESVELGRGNDVSWNEENWGGIDFGGRSRICFSIY